MEDKRHYSFFQNKECEFFPCHKGVDESRFNCLFCYCPLYLKGDRCRGNFTYTKDGIKDCSNCTFPHEKENYDRMIEKISSPENDEKS